MDELGVLIAGHSKNAYWYGSQLTIEEARRAAPYNSATTLQVRGSGALSHFGDDGAPLSSRRDRRWGTGTAALAVGLGASHRLLAVLCSGRATCSGHRCGTVPLPPQLQSPLSTHTHIDTTHTPPGCGFEHMHQQVTSSILAAMVWAIENPSRGLVQPDELDFRRVLEVASPYLGTVAGHYTSWTPLYVLSGSCA
jgi:hypothetical protein